MALTDLTYLTRRDSLAARAMRVPRNYTQFDKEQLHAKLLDIARALGNPSMEALRKHLDDAYFDYFTTRIPYADCQGKLDMATVTSVGARSYSTYLSDESKFFNARTEVLNFFYVAVRAYGFLKEKSPDFYLLPEVMQAFAPHGYKNDPDANDAKQSLNGSYILKSTDKYDKTFSAIFQLSKLDSQPYANAALFCMNDFTLADPKLIPLIKSGVDLKFGNECERWDGMAYFPTSLENVKYEMTNRDVCGLVRHSDRMIPGVIYLPSPWEYRSAEKLGRVSFPTHHVEVNVKFLSH